MTQPARNPDAASARAPASTGSAAGRAAVSAGTGPGDGPGIRILVVDDEPTLRTVIGRVLRTAGHEVATAASAEEALERFREAPFPIVITDIVMAGMSGLDLLREVRREVPDTLVVIMTSHASLETATTALREGAYDFLLKPFEDLFMINAVVDRARYRLELQSRNHLLARQLQTYAEELERLNRELKETADHDGLTGLYNHRYFLRALEIETARSVRHGHCYALIMLDVDHFKDFNDAHGHPAGDEVLRQLATVLRTQREENVCARYGGEEFVLLLPETDRAGAVELAERIRTMVEELAVPGFDSRPLGRITVSLGIACFPEDGRDPAGLVRRADEALYRAKGEGRNRVAA
jgi:diguanylate cyclase (GGDEF)-like protein